MSPSNRVRLSMLGVMCIALLLGGAAGAQTFDETQRALGLGPDPLARSPRMQGMGRLSLVVDSPHNRITMWDFAGNPTGIAESESTSTFDLRPGTSAASDKSDVLSSGAGRERQHLALREMRLGYEAWRRAGHGTAYGAIGDFTRLRHDRPLDDELEVRSERLQPRIMPVLTGQMPYVMPDRMRYALRLQYAYESDADAYRKIVRNGAGEYIDQDGTQVDAPDVFTPDDFTQTGLGIGGAASYRLGEPLTAAVGIDYVSNELESRNDGNRHHTEFTEERPYTTGQATLIGRVGALEYGADGRLWRSASEQRWAFTISSGQGGFPLASRGTLGERREEGGALRTRARWVIGDFELGAGHSTYYRQVETRPPGGHDSTSFNVFRNRLRDRVSADSLALPDSLSRDEIEQRVWDVGGGVAWRLPALRTVVGVEFHTRRDQLQSLRGGIGPKRTGWDVRGGAEWRALENLALRGGYFHRYDDLDDFTEQNEYLTNGVTLGLGLHPSGSIWTLDVAYLVEWTGADFGSPGLPRGNRQNLALQFGWEF